MTGPEAAIHQHLPNELLVRAMDDELTGTEALQVERHLSTCDRCRNQQSELRQVSDDFESFLQSREIRQLAEVGTSGREALVRQLEKPAAGAAVISTHNTLARFGLGLAAAAALALGISYAPFRGTPAGTVGRSAQKAANQEIASVSPFEVNGETFVYLPYSNPDLPLGGSHVVQMEVPIASLADAGVMVAPTASRIVQPDQAVLADVLLGIDGQPIGVHVLSSD